MADLYAGLDVDSMHKICINLKKKLATADAGEQAALELQLDAAMKAMVDAPAARPTSSVSVTDNRLFRAISSGLDGVAKFDGSSAESVTTFLDNVDMLHKTLVESETTDKAALEQHFLIRMKLRLEPIVYKNATIDDLSSYEKLSAWLRKTYCKQLSVFQLLQKAWDAPFDKSQPAINYAQLVESHVRVAETYFMDKFNSQGDGNKTATAHDVFNLMSSMLVVDKLRSHLPNVYNQLTNSLDELKTASDVAAKAGVFKDRLTEEHTIAPAAYYGDQRRSFSRENADRDIKREFNRRDTRDNRTRNEHRPQGNDRSDRGKRRKFNKGNRQWKHNRNGNYSAEKDESEEEQPLSGFTQSSSFEGFRQ